MRKVKLGFAFEGNTDNYILPHIVKRLLEKSLPDISIEPDSLRRPNKKGHGFISDLPRLAQLMNEDNVQILIAVVDTDGRYKSDREFRFQQVQKKIRSSTPICFAYGLAVQTVEAWILADEEAIFSVYDGKRKPEKFPEPESISNPKGELNNLIARLTDGLENSFSTRAEELAEALNLDVVKSRCSSFDDFCRRIENCLKEQSRLT